MRPKTSDSRSKRRSATAQSASAARAAAWVLGPARFRGPKGHINGRILQKPWFLESPGFGPLNIRLHAILIGSKSTNRESLARTIVEIPYNINSQSSYYASTWTLKHMHETCAFKRCPSQTLQGFFYAGIVQHQALALPVGVDVAATKLYTPEEP